MSKTDRHFILATAGHVDHGKSSLVRALTGTDPDRLPEEKKRGISIELGFAELRLPVCDGELVVGVVDVPGHEDFIKTMTAGVAAADAALLVVAADDGPMPQTFEHLEILEYLGVRRGIIVLSKSDLVADLADVTAAVRAQLRASVLADAPIAPFSTHQPATLEAVKRSLASLFNELPAPANVGKPRLWIDRAFSSKGAGTIVAGTLVGGELRGEQAVELQPLGQKAHIRSLHSHHRRIDCADPGSRVAINLPELTLNPQQPLAVSRGQLVTLAGVTHSYDTFDVLLHRSALSQKRELRNGIELRLMLGSAAVMARLHHYESDGLARIKLAAPLPATIGDRFVLRNTSDQATLGGGVILDVAPPVTRRWRTDAKQLRLLMERAKLPHDAKTLIVTLIQRDDVVQIAALQRSSAAADETLHRQIEALAHDKILLLIGDWIVSSSLFRTLADALQSAVNEFHVRHPQRPGLLLSDARALVARAIGRRGTPALIEAIFEQILGKEIERVGNALRTPHFRPALPPRLQIAGDRLRTALVRDGLSPLSRPQLAPGDLEQEALRFLIANGEAIDLGSEIVLASSAFTAAVAAIRQHLATDGPATVSQLKATLHSSRRIMVPLLERLDRDGITRRRGDLRSLPPP